jgi:hypothetical protein
MKNLESLSINDLKKLILNLQIKKMYLDKPEYYCISHFENIHTYYYNFKEKDIFHVDSLPSFAAIYSTKEECERIKKEIFDKITNTIRNHKLNKLIK